MGPSNPAGAQPRLDLPWYGIGFGAAFGRFWRKYATFSGRASLGEYWWVMLAHVIVNAVVATAITVAARARWESLECTVYSDGKVWTTTRNLVDHGQVEAYCDGLGGSFGWTMIALACLYPLVVLLPTLAVTWRRLHDTGRSGAWYFVTLVPFVGAIILLVLLLGKPNPQGVQYDKTASQVSAPLR